MADFDHNAINANAAMLSLINSGGGGGSAPSRLLGILSDSPGFMGPIKGLPFDSMILPKSQRRPGFFGKILADAGWSSANLSSDFKQMNQGGYEYYASVGQFHHNLYGTSHVAALNGEDGQISAPLIG